MGRVIDFQAFKLRKEERQLVQDIDFVPVKYESYCPFCQAPTLRTKTSAGTDIHTFDPDNMEAFKKLRELLTNVIIYFKSTDDGVGDDDLIEAFGEGMREFLKELEQNNGHTGN